MAIDIVGTLEAPLQWEEFERIVQSDIQKVNEERQKPGPKLIHSDWVYRGQANAEWELLTSLERYKRDEIGSESYTVNAREYYKYIDAIVPAVNSLLGLSYDRFNPSEISFEPMDALPNYNLLCFCRHLGFPSPLLDWSKSYFVAAFFAFRSAKPGQPVAIFANQQWRGEAHTWGESEPVIHELGPYVETHERHFKQQSVYTVCSSVLNKQPIFMSHEEAVAVNPQNNKIKKFLLDSSQKEAVLRRLFMMNINDYTLFGDDESLMHMLAFKEFRRL